MKAKNYPFLRYYGTQNPTAPESGTNTANPKTCQPPRCTDHAAEDEDHAGEPPPRKGTFIAYA